MLSPAATILPFESMAMSLISSPLVPEMLVLTVPLVPKVPSGSPAVVSRKSAKSWWSSLVLEAVLLSLVAKPGQHDLVACVHRHRLRAVLQGAAEVDGCEAGAGGLAENTAETGVEDPAGAVAHQPEAAAGLPAHQDPLGAADRLDRHRVGDIVLCRRHKVVDRESPACSPRTPARNRCPATRRRCSGPRRTLGRDSGSRHSRPPRSCRRTATPPHAPHRHRRCGCWER